MPPSSLLNPLLCSLDESQQCWAAAELNRRRSEAAATPPPPRRSGRLQGDRPDGVLGVNALGAR